jgi:hypothetical protein
MRLILSELKSGARDPCIMTVVTGRGNRSGDKGAVLPLQIREFLNENGGLDITEVPGNPGCFVISRGSILKWLV